MAHDFNVETQNGKNHGGHKPKENRFTRKGRKLGGDDLEILLRQQTAAELLTLTLTLTLRITQLHSVTQATTYSLYNTNSSS
mgnify:CR=1 FL=1